MDVAQHLRSCFYIIVLSLSLTACLNEESGSPETKFDNTPKQCTGLIAQGNFIVKWSTGAITLEKGLNRKDFIKNFIKPNNEFIERVEHNLKFQVNAPEISLCQAAGADNWGVQQTRAEYAWQNNNYGQDVLVAVIDSGMDLSHPSLTNQIFINSGEQGLDKNGNDKSTNGIDDDNNGYIDDVSGYDFTADSANVTDDAGHGTHVGGIIAAEHEDTELQTDKVQGIAPKATLLPLDFIDANGVGDSYNAIRSIDYAAAMGAQIINASWGGSDCSTLLHERVQQLEQENILFISAAGNSGNDLDQFPEYPAAFNLNTQITVGALGGFGNMAFYSNYSINSVHLFAPGSEIESSVPGGTACSSGTSMATPFVSGAAALVISQNPELSALEVKDLLLRSVQKNESLLSTSQGSLDIQGSLN